MGRDPSSYEDLSTLIPLPVIMMTGQGDVQSAVRAMRAAVDFIEKPYSDDALFKAIKAALANRSR